MRLFVFCFVEEHKFWDPFESLNIRRRKIRTANFVWMGMPFFVYKKLSLKSDLEMLPFFQTFEGMLVFCDIDGFPHRYNILNLEV